MIEDVKTEIVPLLQATKILRPNKSSQHITLPPFYHKNINSHKHKLNSSRNRCDRKIGWLETVYLRIQKQLENVQCYTRKNSLSGKFRNFSPAVRAEAIKKSRTTPKPQQIFETDFSIFHSFVQAPGNC